MYQFITHSRRKLTKNLNFQATNKLAGLLVLFVISSSCLGRQKEVPPHYFIFPSGNKLQLEFAITDEEQTRGLSGRRIESFPKDRGMLFKYEQSGYRQFWMPETHFDLAIIFLNSEYQIIAFENPVKHHKTREEPIPRTNTYFSRHVLEIRSDSPFVKELERGVQLKLKGPKSDQEK